MYRQRCGGSSPFFGTKASYSILSSDNQHFTDIAELARLTRVLMITRRRFIGKSMAAAATAFVWDAVPAFAHDAGPNVQFPSQVRDRIAVASYPFRDFIVSQSEQSAMGSAPRIELKDFPAHVVSKFNVHNVELWTGHFPSTDAAYLQRFRSALDKARAKVIDIAVDGEHSPYAADRGERDKAVAFSKQWVGIASVLGSPSIRTNLPEAKDAKPGVDLTAESLKRVIEYASSKNIVVHLENDNPVSEDPFFLVKLIERVNSPWLHALPDFANTLSSSDEQHAYAGIDSMFGQAYGICHVKETEVSPSGKVVHVDMKKTFGFLKNHGFKGYCSMEYDSPGDPYAGTAALIEQTLQYLS